MSTYQVLTLLFVAGTFLLALLSYLDKRQKWCTKKALQNFGTSTRADFIWFMLDYHRS
ncbi:putative holin-like toxin [Lactiplantibacillus plantarum]|uniref:putative holin-like toxin n=1 Tax=Lactiplantibacillus plantarum TaxID=1590 RepID=UPI0030AB57EC